MLLHKCSHPETVPFMLWLGFMQQSHFMQQIIETDASGSLVLSADVLGATLPHSQYRLETIEGKLLLEPMSTADHRKMTPEEWERQWKVVQQQVGACWPQDVSAADVISEMRL